MVLSVIQTALTPSFLQHRHRHHHHHHHHHNYFQAHQYSQQRQSRLGLCRGVVSGVVSWTVTMTLLLSSLILTQHSPAGGGGAGVAALSCARCESTLCPDPSDCVGGLVLDVCGCCQVCARVENQSCGGPFGILGKCDGNLHCFIGLYQGPFTTGEEEGICKEHQELSCNDTDCTQSSGERLCPPDSYLTTSSRVQEYIKNSNANYNDNFSSNDDEIDTFSSDASSGELETLVIIPDRTSICVCNKSQCEPPVCAAGYTLHLLQNGTGLPGTCCDVYVCNKSNECQSVICPPYEEELCPEDSVRLPPVWTEDHCCELQQGCTCPPVDECEPVWCPAGFQVQVISRASRHPGSCCDRFRCVNESGLTCTYKGKELKNGEVWNIDKCQTCECRDGLNRCRDKSCENLSCTWMVIPEGECCPVCRGCVSDSGDLYNDSERWKENDCTDCVCKDGHAQCRSTMCEVSCLNPIKVPGECCPVCPDGEPDYFENLCPNMETCDLTCSNGYDQTPSGCPICRCKEEKCELDCQFGRKSDEEGNLLCECRGAEDRCSPHEEEQCEKKCEYGYKRSRDGCIKCKCNKCPQFNCTKRCIHGHILNDEGCALCKCKELPDPDKISSNSNAEPDDLDGKSCMSRLGSRHEDGESWNDGCRVCYCHNGMEMCSLIGCPAPHCSNPVFRVGDCCPTCPGLTVMSPNGEKELCQSQGRYYVEGETWKMDECSICMCHGGTILCETPSCPPVLCHHPVKKKGECCATCKSKDLSAVAVPGHHKLCTSPTGMLYKHGEVWQSTPCQSCVCQDGQMHCYNQMCPPINCEVVVQRKGECCPTCVEVDKPEVCTYNGVTFAAGEKWQGDNCTQCLCSDGQTECFPITCPHLECSVMIRHRGTCCPECYDLLHLQSHSHGWNDKKLKNNTGNTGSGLKKSSVDGNIVGFSVLGVLLLILAVAIVILVWCLMRRKRRSKFRPRPKSTNLELNGQMPLFIPEQQAKTVNVDVDKQYLEKLCPAITSEKGKGDRASNDYTEMVFRDQNKETMANGHFLSSVKS